MKLRIAVLVVAVAASALVAAPAFPVGVPAATPVVSDLDVSDAGHLKASITSPGAAWVDIVLAPGTTPPSSDDEHNNLYITEDAQAVDIETWGYAGTTGIWASACRQVGVDCSAPVRVASFDANDPGPAITFSDDLTVGPDQPIRITVADSGGPLRATWMPDDGNGRSEWRLGNSGVTEVRPYNGVGRLEIARCSDRWGGQPRCHVFDSLSSPKYDVRSWLQVSLPAAKPISLDNPATDVSLRTSVPGEYDISWRLTRNGGGEELSGSVQGGQTDANGALSPITIHGDDITDGSFKFSADLTLRSTEFGTYTTTVSSSDVSNQLLVDRVAPVITSARLDRSVIYPNVATTNHPGYVTVAATYGPGNGGYAEVHASDDSLVRRLEETGYVNGDFNLPKYRWDGTGPGGRTVAPGQYKVFFVDGAGNRSPIALTVTVSALRKVLTTSRRTFTARSLLVDSSVGKCSKLSKPSARRWPGSLGLYSNAKCGSTSWKASAVTTVYAVTLPAAESYVDLRLETYGGAARSRPKSKAVIGFLKTSGSWDFYYTLDARVRTHGRTEGISTRVFPDRSFVWGIYTSNRNRYDLRRFTLTLRYYRVV